MTTALDDKSPFAALTGHERDELLALEATIEAGQKVFFQVGAALLAIRDRRLYRERHQTFEAYIQARWGFSRPRAYQFMDAASVAQNLSTTVDIKRLNERQTRALAPLTPDDQRVVYKLAKATAPKGRITAAHVKSLAAVAQDVMRGGTVDDGTGVMVAWDTLSPERRAVLIQTNVDEAVYKTWKRHQTHVARLAVSSESYEWHTPRGYVAAAREVMGGIDLDPASSVAANEIVQAATVFSVDDDGLTHEWQGRVWLNPPYSKFASQFVAHLVTEFAAGRVTAAIVLLSAHNTDRSWFQPLWDYACCFTNHRIAFIKGDDGQAYAGNNHGSVFCYLGTDVERFERVFEQFGTVVGTRRAWRR